MQPNVVITLLCIQCASTRLFCVIQRNIINWKLLKCFSVAYIPYDRVNKFKKKNLGTTL